MASITVSSDLLELLGKKLYSSDHSVILVRELLQNAFDACHNNSKSKLIDIEINTNLIQVSDNGIGMNEDTLLNVFLSIGASRKLDNSIGGFGIAKVSLFTCKKWQIYTKSLLIDQNLEIKKFKGIENHAWSTIVTGETTVDSYSEILRMIIFNDYEDTKIRFHLFNENLKVSNYKAGKLLIGNLCGANIYKARKLIFRDVEYKGYMIYRINGLTQFTRKIDNSEIDYNLIIEFNGIDYKPRDDNYPFDLSRENLKYMIMYQLQIEINKIIGEKINNDDSDKLDKIRIVNGYLYANCKPSGISLADKRIAKIWYRMIELMINHEIERGYVKGNYIGMKKNNAYFINPSEFTLHHTKESLIASLFHLACHEVSHEKYQYHNEDFTSHEGCLSREFAYIVNDEQINRLAWYALKD